jgi:hypothetical protein
MSRSLSTSILALALAATAASAQIATLPSVTVPSVTDVNTFVALNTAGAPAGTYRAYSMTMNWSDSAGSGAYSEEAQPSLYAGATTSSTLHAFGRVGRFSNSNENNVALSWQGNLINDYTGGQPLFLAASQLPFVGGTPNASWANVSVTLQSAAYTAPAVFEDFGTANFGSVGTSVPQTFTGSFAAGDVKWFKVVIPAPGITTGALDNGNFLDITTQNSAGRSIVYLFDENGFRLRNAPLSSSAALFGTMSFGGTTTPRDPNSVVPVFAGGDGGLPAGTYWLAVTARKAFFAETNTVAFDGWQVFNDGASTTGSYSIQLTYGRVSPVANCTISETEPNDTKATAQAISFTAFNDVLCGTCTGNSQTNPGAGSADYYKISVPQAPAGQIYRHRMHIETGGSSFVHNFQMRSLDVVGGVIDTASDELFTNAVGSTNPSRLLQFYTLGSEPNPYVIVRVTGTASTTNPYKIIYDGFDAVTIDELGSFAAGNTIITTAGDSFLPNINGGIDVVTTDTDMWIYDASFNPIADAGNDDPTNLTGPQSAALTRSLNAGTYYLAISNFDVANNQTPAFDEGRPNKGNAMDSAGVIACSEARPGVTAPTALINYQITLTDSVGASNFFFTNKSAAFEVRFIRFTLVGAPSAPRCNGADIAYDTGDFLPRAEIVDGTNGTPAISGPSLGVNNGVTEADYNVFFANYFDAFPVCDIANDDNTSRVPTPAPGTVVNNGVTEGDYNFFFSVFFDGCAL